MIINLQKNNYPGTLLVFCGIDGSGKTTMMDMLHKYLTTEMPEREAIFTKQPRDVVRNMDMFKKMMYTKNPNVDYRALVLLTLSERMQHCYEEIVPALKQGKIIVSDRYIYTTIANMIARGYENENWFFDVIQHIPRPDIAFLANVPSELAISRIMSREEEKDRYLDKELYIKVADNFRNMASDAGFTLLDTSGDPSVPFEVVKQELHRVLELKSKIKII